MSVLEESWAERAGPSVPPDFQKAVSHAICAELISQGLSRELAQELLRNEGNLPIHVGIYTSNEHNAPRTTFLHTALPYKLRIDWSPSVLTNKRDGDTRLVDALAKKMGLTASREFPGAYTYSLDFKTLDAMSQYLHKHLRPAHLAEIPKAGLAAQRG